MAGQTQVKVEITAVDQAGAIIKNIERELGGLASSVQGLGGMMSTLGVGFAGGGLLGVVTGIARLANSTAEMEAGLGRASEATALSVEALAALKLVSEETGESFESLTTGLARLGKNIGEGLDKPSSKAAVILKALGVNLKELRLEDVDHRVSTVVKAIYQLGDASERQLALSAMFGKGWMTNAETLRRVAEEGIEPLIKKAEELEGHIGPEQVAAAKAYEKSWADMAAQFGIVKREIGEGLIPMFTDLFRLLRGDGGVSTQAGTVFGEIDLLRTKAAALRKEQADANASAKDWIHLPRENWIPLPFEPKSLSARANAYGRAAAEIENFINKQNDAAASEKRAAPDAPKVPGIGLELELGGEGKGRGKKSKGFGPYPVPKDEGAALIGALIKEDETFGMTADQVKTYEASLAGADKAELAMASHIAAGIEVKRRAAKADKDAKKATDDDRMALEQFAQTVHEGVETAAEKLQIELDKVTEAFKAGALSADDYNRAIQQIGTSMENLKADSNSASQSVSDVTQLGAEMGQTVGAGLTQMITKGQGFKDMLSQLLDELIKFILKVTIFNELAGMAGGAGGFVGAFLGNLGGHAAGGDVTAGVPSIVGEAGPELFVPSSGGSIIPHGKFGSGGNVTNFYYSVDARGADAFADKRLLLAMQMTRQAAVNQAVNQAREAQLRRA